ncbi:Pleckstrin homology domain-containing protein [Amylocystis lapponica]|nr:Pleckstrin homology domain-containing protein [Amylocystis lapponica]
MVAASLPVVASRDPTEDEDELAGEKPHIVPECGHALHEACFVAVYGPLPNPSRAGNDIRKSSLGVCGVCRRPMKVGDGDGGKSNKLAALTGMGDPNSPHVFPGRDTPSSMWSLNGRHLNSGPRAYDPTEDDPLDHHAVSVRSGMQEQTNYSLAFDPSALPGKRVSTHVPGTVMPLPEPYGHKTEGSSSHSVRSSPLPEYSMFPSGNGNREPPSRAQTMSPMSQDSPLHPHHLQEETVSEDSPFNAITEDLRNRIIDWKGRPLSGLGPLQMYDLLAVRRDTLVREFFVYLFKEAIICVVEEKKRTLGRLLSSASGAASAFSDGSGMGPSNAAAASKGVLRLKGRIYIRHIKQVTDTSLSGELSLTTDMGFCVTFPSTSLSTCTICCATVPTGMNIRPGRASCSTSSAGIVGAAAPT